jgi:hypothetical protein
LDRRAHEVAHGPCFLIFENYCPDGGFGEQLREDRETFLAAEEICNKTRLE